MTPRRRTAAYVACLALYGAAFLAAQATFPGRVVSVIDGDTIGVMRDGREVRIRLEGIDAPEDGQDFSQRAKQFISAAVFGKTVDVRVKETDRYGRLVARVIADGRQDVSVSIVEAGLAWHYLRILQGPDPGARRTVCSQPQGRTLDAYEPHAAVGVPQWTRDADSTTATVGNRRCRVWVSGVHLARQLNTNLRSLRDAAHHSGGDIIGGQKGYALIGETPVHEVRAVIARHLSQSREQRERALEIERAFHRATGEAA